jgi:lipoprotein-releasing system permease protein
MQADYDNYVITNLPFVQELTSYKNGEISALEIKLETNAPIEVVQKQMIAIMGEEYVVKNRYQQDEALYKITNMEKWFAFIIFAFTLVLVAFNMVGALWMLVLEKKEDIATIKAMGGSSKLVRNIFLAEGYLLSIIGVSIGCVLAIILCILQQKYGLVTLAGSGEFIVDYYPVEMRWTDFAQVIFTVVSIGAAAAWIPAHRASKIDAIIHKK